MGRSIVITSGKGGSGKSTLTAALGRAFAEAGKSCVLVDMDMGMRSLDLMLGIQDKVVYDLADVAEGMVKIRPALVKVDGSGELFVLNAAQAKGSDSITAVQIERVIDTLKEKFDFVCIDCPAGVGRGFRNALSGADEAIIVALPDQVSVRDAERVMGLVNKAGVSAPKLVINRMPMDAPPPNALSIEAIQDVLRLELLGWVAEDPGIGRGRENVQMAWIAARLMGQHIAIEPYRRMGYFARLGRALMGK